MSETPHTPPPQSAPPGDCGCPPESNGSSTDCQQAAIISADLDAGTSGIKLMTDVLGSDFVDVSVGLGAVDGVLGLTDTGTGLLDGLLCDIV